MNQNQAIRFFYNCSSFYFPNREKLKSFILKLIKKEGRSVDQIRIIFCEKKELRQINRKFLDHDYDTDIITFPLSNLNNKLEAELYISIPKLKEQSKGFNCTFKEELHRVIFHGILHLCGYNDKSSSEVKEMRSKEDYFLKKYFI